MQLPKISQDAVSRAVIGAIAGWFAVCAVQSLLAALKAVLQ